MQQTDVIVVGAGAAGVGAGQALARRGVSHVILEAAGRVGGRAFTDTTSLPHAWDQGCHWMHCADVNPLVAWADRLGVPYERQDRMDHSWYWSGGAWADAATLDDWGKALDAGYDAIYDLGPANDVPISRVLPGSPRWQASIDYILQLMSSDDPARVSASGYADYQDTEVNWPVTGGYGTLIGLMAKPLPVQTNSPVRAIELDGTGVRVTTDRGDLQARAVIVTASTAVIRSGAIRFGPGTAQPMLDLIQDVPCGAYEKVAIALDRPLIDDPKVLFCTIDPTDGSGLVNFQTTEPERPMMIAHMGGSVARELKRQGNAAMTAYAIDRLLAAFGSGARSCILGTAVTSWLDNPLVQGAYSYARPGTAEGRRRMIAAQPFPVAFAGEAFAPAWQATAHGAWQSGQDTASRVADTLLAG